MRQPNAQRMQLALQLALQLAMQSGRDFAAKARYTS